MKELSFLLSLKNNLSSPLGKAQQSVEGFAKKSQAAFKQVGIGAAGLWGVGMAVKGLLKPAHDMNEALAELSTRDVSPQGLKDVYNTAQQFSTTFGKSALDFVASATAIKGSIAGLSDKELPRYALAANTLAIITKGSAEQTASYLTDMANKFRSETDRMGAVPFAETMASKTAYMVKNFGTDMDKIRGMLESSKNAGSNYGASMDEQLVVLGKLSQRIGSGAGSAYEKFLKNAVAGGKQLGMSFTDAQGQLLSFPDILQKLEGKFGHSIEGNVKAQEVLNKAFGKGALALTAAWGQADSLRKHMRDMGNTQGLDKATEMASTLADLWERVEQVFTRVRTAIGMALLPALSPLIEAGIKGGAKFAKWMEMFPNIARWVGYLSMATLAFAAAGALANIVMGISKFIAVGLIGIYKGLRLVVLGVAWALNFKARMMQIVKISVLLYSAALRGLRVIMLAGSIAMWAYGGATAFAGAAMQVLMSPITLVIAILALLAVGVWYVIKHWDELKAALLDSAAFKWVMAVAAQAGELFESIWASIKLGWQMVVDFFTGLSPVEAFSGFVDAIGNVFSGLWSYLTESFAKTYNWIVTKLNKIPGVNIDLKPVGDAAVASASGLAPAGLNAPEMERGGIGKAIANSSNSKVTDNSRKIGTVNIYPQNGETFDSLVESRELAAG
ncbi:phage tail tape measure protein [Serratia sp. S1B]|nr:phage tail tape measure protein [Serratia sp. S1B]